MELPTPRLTLNAGARFDWIRGIERVFDIFRGYADEAFSQIYPITNDRWSRYVYSGFDLSARKRTTWVQPLGGHTRGLQRVAGTWRPDDPASFLQPDAFPNDKGIGSIRADQAGASRTRGSASGQAPMSDTSKAPHVGHDALRGPR